MESTAYPVECACLLDVGLEPERYDHTQREVAECHQGKQDHHEVTQPLLLSDGVGEGWDSLVNDEGIREDRYGH